MTLTVKEVRFALNFFISSQDYFISRYRLFFAERGAEKGDVECIPDLAAWAKEQKVPPGGGKRKLFRSLSS